VGVARAERLDEEGRRLREWLDRGFHATMGWMARTAERRTDPALVLPGARSVVAVAMNYFTPSATAGGPGTGKVSRYAWGEEYHTLMEERLDTLWRWMASEFPGIDGKRFIDAGPAMDKAWAARAGIGWIGKHTNVITRGYGSWVFLGEIVTTLELPPDEPAVDRCGTCTRCIDACPTDALVQPYLLDARRCIAYLTIEHRGPFEPDAGDLHGWVFGCDDCQDVCPWNTRHARPTDERAFLPREGHVAPSLDAWEGLTEEEFRDRFSGSPMRRAKSEGMTRNIRAVRRGDPSGAQKTSHRESGPAGGHAPRDAHEQ
jgi:epoxyqueuosine reductase